jgi:prepilin-type N-terminal cleavage/methylation domain-containing protein
MNSGRAFTLVEVLIVVIILAILAATVVPQFANATTEADHVAASQLVGVIQRKIGEHYAINGAWPTAIDSNWFAPSGLPRNPYTQGPATLTVQNIADKRELDIKHSNGGPIIYWYNQATGSFHTRVPWQGNNQDTLDLYNRINHSEAKNF